MRPISMKELLSLSRSELFAVHAKVVSHFEEALEDSYDRLVAHGNMRLVRYVLSRQPAITPLRRRFGMAPCLG